MTKQWVSMERVISSNTNQEIIKELYIDGTTAMYTRRLKEINAEIKKENEIKQARRNKKSAQNK